jgi:hypothetical protein
MSARGNGSSTRLIRVAFNACWCFHSQYSTQFDINNKLTYKCVTLKKFYVGDFCCCIEGLVM